MLNAEAKSAGSINPPHLRRRRLHTLLSVFVVLLPVVMGVGLLWLAHQTTFAAFMPIWTDEIYYWHQSATFKEVGLDGGYYTYAEQPAPVGGFYAWGAVVPALYGSMGRFLGWSLSAMPIFNLIFMSIALAVFIRLTRPTIERLLWLGAVIGTFIPFWLFQSASMIEVLQYALAILVASAFFVILHLPSEPPAPRYRAFALALVLLFIAALIRLTWVLLIFPLCLAMVSRFSWRSVSLAALGAGMFFGMTWLLSNSINSPYRFFLTDFAAAFAASPRLGSVLLIQKILENFALFNQGAVLEVALRYQLLTLIVILAGSGIWQRGRLQQTMDNATPIFAITHFEILLHLYNLGYILLINVFFYDIQDWRDYRLIAPHILFSLVLLVAHQRRRVLAVMLALTIMLLPQAWTTYTQWTSEHLFPNKRDRYEEWQSKLAPVLQYQPNAPNPWCNSLLHTPYYLFNSPYMLLAVDRGIGLSFAFTPEEWTFPPRSRYLMLDHDFIQKNIHRLQVVKLLEIPSGNLYINRDSDCPRRRIIRSLAIPPPIRSNPYRPSLAHLTLHLICSSNSNISAKHLAVCARIRR